MSTPLSRLRDFVIDRLRANKQEQQLLENPDLAPYSPEVDLRASEGARLAYKAVLAELDRLAAGGS